MTQLRLIASRLGVFFAIAALLVGAAPSRGAAQAGELAGIFGGGSFGTFANSKAGSTATKLGRSAFLLTGCKGTDGATRTLTANQVDAGKVASAGQLYSTVFTDKTATSAALTNTSRVSMVRALDGRIKSDRIQAVAQGSASTSRVGTTSFRSRFENLTILGRPVATSVPNNTRMEIPGFGYVILKETVQRGDGVNSGSISINMLKIVITQANSLNIPVGSQIVIAHADGSFSRTTVPVLVGGNAFVTTAKSSSPATENSVGRAAPVYLGCLGTNGAQVSNEVSSVSAPGMVSSATGRSTAYGNRTDTQTTALTTSTVQSVNLLSGRITADGVRGVAKSTLTSAGGVGSTDGSYFQNLRVLGVAVPTPVKPNTRVELPGIGYAILYQQAILNTPTGGRAGVNMIHVFVTTPNTLNLPVGSEIFVAQANSTAYR